MRNKISIEGFLKWYKGPLSFLKVSYIKNDLIETYRREVLDARLISLIELKKSGGNHLDPGSDHSPHRMQEDIIPGGSANDKQGKK